MIRIISRCSLFFLLYLSLPANAATHTGYATISDAYAQCEAHLAASQNWQSSGYSCMQSPLEPDKYIELRQSWASEYSFKNRYQFADGCPAGQPWDGSQCSPPPCEAPNFINESGECVTPTAPSECYEQGLAYDSQTQQCTEVCEAGVLNGVCLNPTPLNEESCNSQSPDYQGYFGNGDMRVNLCSSDMQCVGGQFGLVNKEKKCIPDEYGPPACDANGIITIDEYGYVCETPQDAPEVSDPDAEEPNTDTDGDGEPDEYQRENDPLAGPKATDKTNDLLSDANSELKKGNQKSDQIYGAIKELVGQGEQRSEEIGEATDLLNGNTSNVGNLGDSGLDLTDSTSISVVDELGDWQNVADPTTSECPAPREIVLGLGTFQVKWEPWCDFAQQLRPFTIFMFSFIGAMAIARTFVS